ncbi:MAG: hypothetical protein LBC18_00695 [Opitutaceae bacterium]|jgi:hypothetical protein|nr:hypothetical protein [Opitutaceae bacterium]
MELSRHKAAACPPQKPSRGTDRRADVKSAAEAAAGTGIIKKLAAAALIRGYDAKDHCVYANVLEKEKDSGWKLTEIRHQKYRKLGIRKLSVLMIGPDGETWRLPDDILPA